jgi:uncharacterized membrane protein
MDPPDVTGDKYLFYLLCIFIYNVLQFQLKKGLKEQVLAKFFF